MKTNSIFKKLNPYFILIHSIVFTLTLAIKNTQTKLTRDNSQVNWTLTGGIPLSTKIVYFVKMLVTDNQYQFFPNYSSSDKQVKYVKGIY